VLRRRSAHDARDVVGKPASEIAERAASRWPRGAAAHREPEGIGAEHPLSHEILAPVLAATSSRLRLGARGLRGAEPPGRGRPHRGLWAEDERVVADFAQMNAGRIVVNHPSTEGAIGGIFNALRRR